MEVEMCCASIGFVLIAVFYYKFPETRKSFFGFWINRLPIDPKAGFASALKEFGPLLLLYFGWAMVVISFAASPDLKVNTLPVLPYDQLAGLVILTILLEELMFRGFFLFASFLAQKIFSWNINYAMGLISSVGFGLIHLSNYEQVSVSTVILITIQTLGGFIFWWLAKRYTFMTAVWCHIILDAIVMIPAAVLGSL